MKKLRIAGAALLAGVLMTGGFTAASAAPVKTAAVPSAVQSAAAVAPLLGVQESAYVAITPCRIVDTRLAGGNFTDRQVRSLKVIGSEGFPAQGGKAGGCGIPTTATAIAASLSAVVPQTAGFVRVYPANQSEPVATVLNYSKGMNTTNGAILTIQVGASPAIKVKNYYGPTGVVIDVTGYFAPQIAVSLDAVGNILSGGSGISSITNPSAGTYVLTTDADIRRCTPSVTGGLVASTVGGNLLPTTAGILVLDANHLQVNVGLLGLTGLVLQNAPITVKVAC